ncbi:MAG: class I SAM-dependent methyltransferase [Candidatus Absconditabacterales bacterium]
MTIQDELRKFYDAEAMKYAQTREKHRSEAKVFLDEIHTNSKKSLRILDFGCGSGRLLKQLTEIKGKKITYIGVDLSPKLLSIARKQVKESHKYLNCTFICEDISKHIKKYRQESFDYIIGVASFQHIPTNKERFYLTKSFYRLLHYGGKLMMTNWSFSRRFLRKYQHEIIKAGRKFLLSRGKKDWKDLILPRKAQGHIFHRFYHIFTPKELNSLATLSGFQISSLQYLDEKGEPTASRKNAKNTLLIAKKNVFTDQK